MRESSESVFIERSLWVRHLSFHFIFTVLYNFSNEETGLLEYNSPKINQRERHSRSITQALSKYATVKPIAMKIETYFSPFSPCLDFARLCFIITLCVSFLLNCEITEDTGGITHLYSSHSSKLECTHANTNTQM